jgi:NADPH-dependent 2,4-dienoyl-CoA reductase/sulfur reductase-like enzyme/nitrite reductase/ring-hydroxylating ferredoxin subunit
MGADTQLTGPDLRAGVDVATLRDGEPLLGQVDDNAVVLVRAADEFFAVGATCTHWSGPLADGIVTGEQIRCPWHHACFSLRTGEVLSPPALAALPRWRTSVREGRVYVEEKLDYAGMRAPAPASTRRPMVIVGAGAAGMIAAETLRKEGYDGRIVLVDPEADAPYDRPNLSKDFLAGNAPEEWLQLRGDDFWRELNIERVVAAVEFLDPTGRRMGLSNGNAVEYDTALLATGAAAIRPPIPGGEQAHVHVLRTRADCTRLIGTLAAKPRVVIAGASFIGLEAAAALRQRGVDVTVVAPEAVPFARVLGEEIGRMLQARHEREGVTMRLGRTIKQINERDVVLDNGDILPADVVLLGVGVRPALQLAESASLRVDKGVIVDEYLQTSARGIYAAGDIARYPDPRTGELIRIEHWVLAQRQGQTAARNMLGRKEAFTAAPFFWTTQYDVTVSYVGHAGAWDSMQVSGSIEDLDCTVAYLQGGEARAIVTINRDTVSLNAEVAFERNLNLLQVANS